MSRAGWMIALVASVVGCGSARTKDTARQPDARTAITATQKAGLGTHMREADPDELNHRYGVEEARARREERNRQKAEQKARADVVDDKKPTPP